MVSAVLALEAEGLEVEGCSRQRMADCLAEDPGSNEQAQLQGTYIGGGGLGDGGLGGGGGLQTSGRTLDGAVGPINTGDTVSAKLAPMS